MINEPDAENEGFKHWYTALLTYLFLFLFVAAFWGTVVFFIWRQIHG